MNDLKLPVTMKKEIVEKTLLNFDDNEKKLFWEVYIPMKEGVEICEKRTFLEYPNEVKLIEKLKNKKMLDDFTKEALKNDNSEQIKHPFFWGLVILSVIALCLTLPFHYVIDHQVVFLKSSLSFDKTFVTQKVIDEMIIRYNKSIEKFDFLEIQAIRNEPLHKKLVEKGIIIKLNDKE